MTPLAVKDTTLVVELVFDTPNVCRQGACVPLRGLLLHNQACRQMLTITAPAFLASVGPQLSIAVGPGLKTVAQCMCRSAALMLPPYSESDPHSDVLKQDWTAPLGPISERKNECFCGVESHAVEEITAALETSSLGYPSDSPRPRPSPLHKDSASDLSLTRSWSAL